MVNSSAFIQHLCKNETKDFDGAEVIQNPMKQNELQPTTGSARVERLRRQTAEEGHLSSQEQQKRQRAEDRRWLQDRREEVRHQSERRKSLDERRAQDRI